MAGRAGADRPVASRPSKRRLDQLLVTRGLAPTRAKAQALIMAGHVFAGETRLEKPGQLVREDTGLEIRGAPHGWVSRGGVKLAHALEHFKIDVDGLVALDVGASTGGFTDVLLSHGAKRVYAVDVGRGQLDWKLRQDSRVVVLERTNVRNLSVREVPEPVDLIVCDVSFISLRTALPAALALAAPDCRLVALIKPQFEAGREQVGRKGVVRDRAVHEAVCASVSDWLARQPGWEVLGIIESPIRGPEGNREFLLAGRRVGS